MVSEHASPLAVLGGVDAGGQNVHVAALSKALADRGHEVAVYTRRDDPGLPERVPAHPGVTVVHVPAGPARVLPKDDLLPYMAEFGRWLAEDWVRPGAGAARIPDLVHAHFWMSGLAAWRAARQVGVPVAQTFHALGSVKRRYQGADDTSPPERLAAERAVGRGVDLIVATCRDEVTELGRMGVRGTPVHVVPCGVDTDLFTPDGPVAARDPRHPVRLVTIGRLVPRKGVATAVEALADLPGTELLVAGGPAADDLAADAEAVRLRDRAAELGVADRVRLLGRVAHEELPALIRSADAVVATPWYEPFGIVPLEAAACGVPVVGSAVGGLLDSVEDGVTGRLVPARDPVAVARAVRELATDPLRRRRAGQAARRRAITRFSWERVAEATEDAYRALLPAEREVAG
jgi:glycosyltransferase involved in cell wall biosynthesis